MFQGLDWKHFFDSGLVFSTKQGRILLSWGPVTESSSPLKTLNTWSFFCSDFYLKKPSYLSFKYNIECSVKECFKYLNLSLDQKPQSLFSDLNFLLFKTQFKQIQNQIQKKTITKAVPVLSQIAKNNFSLLEKKYLLKCLLDPSKPAVKQALHIYGLFLNEQAILGASPEILFSYNTETKILDSMALAGTHLASAKKNSLLLSEKNKTEQKLVSQYLQKALAQLGDIKHLSQSGIYETKAGSLKHLCTDFKIAVKQFDLQKSICCLHPTPALGTAPKKDFLFLQSLDAGGDRLKYGAPFVGISPKGDVKAVVAIRNIQWTTRDLYLFVGCGIIAKSDLQKEFQELDHKIKSVKLLLGL